MEVAYENYLIKACPSRKWALERGWKVKGNLADPGDARFGKMPVVLRDHEIICLDPNSDFGAGSVVDCMVFCDRISYKKAVRDFIASHGDYFEKHVPFDRTYLADVLAIELLAHRRLFNWTRRQLHTPKTTLGTARATSWLSANRIRMATATSILFTGNEATFEEFLNLAHVTNSGLVDILPGSKSDLVFLPYYRSFGRLVRMDILDPKSGKRLEAPLGDYAVAYMGLQDIDPRADEVRIATSPWTAAALRSENKSLHPKRYYTRLATRPDMAGSIPHTKFARGVYLHTPNTVPHTLLTLPDHVDDVFVADNELVAPVSPSIPYKDFLLKYIAVLYRQQKGFTKMFRTFLEPLRSNARFLEDLCEYLKNANMHGAVSRISAWLNVDVLRQSGMVVQETEYGYEALDEKTGRRRLISNFTLKIECTVYYPQSGDVFCHGTAQMGEVAVAYGCAESRLKQPTALAVRLAKRMPEGVDEPRLLEKPASKLLSALWTARAEAVPRDIGCDWLGWSGNRSRFFGIGWVADKNGVNGMRMRYHPSQELFENFDPRGPVTLSDLPPPPNYLDEGMQDLLNVAAAWMGRGYVGRTLNPVEFLDTPGTRALLSRLFRLLGQHKPLRLNPNLRSLDREKDFSLTGYPVLAEGYTALQSERSTLPFVLLLPKAGVSITREYDPHQVVVLGRIFTQLMARVAAGLISGRMTHDGRDVGDRHMSLCLEGRQLIRAVAGWEEWCSDRYEHVHLYRYLKTFNAQTVSNAITAEFADQVAVLNVRHTEVRRKDLIQDLDALGIPAKLDPKNPYKITAGLADIKGLLDERFGVGAVTMDQETPDSQPLELPKAQAR